MGFPVNFPSNQSTKHYFVIIPATLQLASTNLTKCPFRQSLHRAKLPWRSPAKSRCRAQNCGHVGHVGHVGHALYVYTYIIYIYCIYTYITCWTQVKHGDGGIKPGKQMGYIGFRDVAINRRGERGWLPG